MRHQKSPKTSVHPRLGMSQISHNQENLERTKQKHNFQF